jgi:hypothetical protein
LACTEVGVSIPRADNTSTTFAFNPRSPKVAASGVGAGSFFIASATSGAIERVSFNGTGDDLQYVPLVGKDPKGSVGLG